MIDYSSFVTPSTAYEYKTEERPLFTVSPFSQGGLPSTQMVRKTRVVARKTGTDEAFNDAMAGLADQSEDYIKNVGSMLSSYAGYISEYKGNIQPINDALDGNIEDFEKYISKYEDYTEESQKFLSDNQDLFTNGIVLDPNASRTRAEYTGAVADQYEVAKETLGRDMASQGLNPYSNKGANRELTLDRAKNMGLASGQAYTDWRASYNRDKQAQQNAVGLYAGLRGDTENSMKYISDSRLNVFDKNLSRIGYYDNLLKSQLTGARETADWNKQMLGYTTDKENRLLDLKTAQVERENEGNILKSEMQGNILFSKLDRENL